MADRIESIGALPLTVKKLEGYLQELWMGVYNSAVEAQDANPEARAYRTVEWYMANREHDEERALLLRVITPGKVRASSGEMTWTRPRQDSLLHTAEQARGHGIVTALYYGDHKDKVPIGWALEVFEEDHEGKPWVYVRPYISDEGIRAKMFDGTLRYISAEIYPERDLYGHTYKDLMTGVVILDPARIPDTYPAVENSGVIVASHEADNAGATGPIYMVNMGIETERRTSMPPEDKGAMTIEDVLAATNKVAEGVETLTGTINGVAEGVETLSGRVGSIEDRMTALERVPEQTPEEVKEEVKASLQTLSEDPKQFVACLSAGSREGIVETLSAVEDKGTRAALLSIIGELPKIDLTEQTRSPEPGKGAGDDDPMLKFTATPEDDAAKAKLRYESVSALRLTVDASKLPEGRTVQEEAVALSMAKFNHLWV